MGERGSPFTRSYFGFGVRANMQFKPHHEELVFMTIVARFGIQGCPMLMGDLLLSGPELPGSKVFLPTTEDFSAIFPAGSTKVPRGIRQKIAVVSDKLVVGWAGKLSIAQNVIAELVRRSQSEPFTRESLQQYFDGLNQAVWEELGLAGFIEDDAGMTSFCCESTTEFSTPLLGKVALLGSGAEGVGNMLEGI